MVPTLGEVNELLRFLFPSGTQLRKSVEVTCSEGILTVEAHYLDGKSEEIIRIQIGE